MNNKQTKVSFEAREVHMSPTDPLFTLALKALVNKYLAANFAAAK